MQILGKKALRLVIVVVAVSVLTFLMINLLPGDVAHVVGGEEATLEDIQAIRKKMGLDQGIVVRYFTWLKNAASGDLGESYLTHEPVVDMIIARLPVTIELLIISQCMALMLALPSGIVSAYRSNSMMDRLVNGIGFATLSIPSFVMALLTIYLFSIKLRWLPATGYVPLSIDIGTNLKSYVLPGLSIAMIEWVVLMRVLRSDMITTLGQNYILMARAKGLPAWRVLLQHALRPSSFTLITVLGIQIGRHLGEAVIVETIFALPGIGRLLIDSIYARDYQMVQGCVLLITVGYVVINSFVDLLYAVLDPRIRTEGGHAG
ncbi:peptide ABC transporter [Desulfosarcina widdelii]|uniref:Peptide ABC transporter n=1 Tax=Desulfosarcina widdelii TaxID=947919 RepID=A0A5K7Z261_9BACT|nr:ABC transporter permease [Desulfosarcina widdelii]BBO74805.1 peptide ABC transporter [Desulfosarcina widdelii]